MPIGRINFREISCISHITANILLKRTNIFLFAPSTIMDINLVSLHEIVQLLLSYILSNHLRLTNSVIIYCNAHELLLDFVHRLLAGPLNYRLPGVRIQEHVFLPYGLYLKFQTHDTESSTTTEFIWAS